ncbi:hypothetical protein AB9K24_05630 [Meridianimaribacter flavus]
MELKYTIKIIIAVIIISATLYSYRKRKIENKTTPNGLNKKEPTVFINNEKKKESLEYLYKCIDITINHEDAKKLKSFIAEKVKKENQTINWDIKEEFINQEIINFQYYQNVFFYGCLDWKESSDVLEKYIKAALKSNFNIDIDFKDILNTDEDKTIHHAFEKYENALNDRGIALRDVDINSDSYQIVLIKKDNLTQFTSLIEKIGFKVRKIEWGNSLSSD